MIRAIKFAAYAAAPNVLSLALTAGSRTAGCPRTSLQPPGWVFAVVWPILYLGLGFAMALLADKRKTGPVLAIAGLVIALNAWWLVFGRKCRPVPALAAIVAITVLAAAVTKSVHKTDMVAGVLVAPLVAWLSFATVLSVQQVLLSKGMIRAA
jgi:translocator protein